MSYSFEVNCKNLNEPLFRIVRDTDAGIRACFAKIISIVSLINITKGWKIVRIVLSVLAVLLILVGILWFLQGINVIGGSIMTGQSQWAIYGGIAVVAGIGLLVFANRKKASLPKE
jgi:hypothetical protein